MGIGTPIDSGGFTRTGTVTVNNSGTIEGSSAAIVFRYPNHYDTILNNNAGGVIRITDNSGNGISEGGRSLVVNNALGATLSAGSFITNSNVGASITTVQYAANSLRRVSDTINNSGTINGYLWLGADAISITNSGTINGGISILTSPNPTTITVTNNSGATITLTSSLRGTTNTVTNYGTMGAVGSSSGGILSVTNHPGATISGGVFSDNQNDTIINRGTISGNINTNAGDDTITLESAYSGNIDMGTGTDDTLNLGGSQTYSFTPSQLTNVDVVNLKGGSTFNMNGQYSFGKSFTVEQNAKLTLASGSKLTTLGNTTVNNGTIESASGTTIEVVGPYQQTSTGILNLKINATNNTVPSGLSVTGGAVTLGGTLNVTDVGDGSFARSDRFDVVVSDSSVSGSFETLNAPLLTSLPGLEWVQYNNGSKLTLVIEAQADCEANHLSANSYAVCKAVNVAVVTEQSTNDCRSIIDRLEEITGTPLFHEELMAISPQGYGYVMDSNLLFQQAALTNLGSNSVARHTLRKDNQRKYWMHLLHDDQRKDDSFYYDEWKNKRNGIFVGSDYRPHNKRLIRVSAGYTDQKLTIPGTFKNESHEGHVMGLVREDLWKHIYMQGSAAYEHGRHSATRRVPCAYYTRTPKGEFATHTMTGRFELGSQFEVKGIDLNPWTSLMHQRFISTHQREKEGGDAELEIEQMRQQAMLHQLGLRASTNIPVVHIGVLRPYIELSHQKDMKRMGNYITSRILGVPFTITTMGNQTSNQISGGFQFELRNNTMIHADYLYREIDNATKEHQFMLGGKILM